MADIPWAMQDLLARKYAIMQQQADAATFGAQTQRIGVQAAAGLDQARAAVVLPESNAQVKNQNAATALAMTQNRLLPLTTDANIGLTRAQTGNTIANTALTGEQVTAARMNNRVVPGVASALGNVLGATRPALTFSTSEDDDPLAIKATGRSRLLDLGF